MESRTSHMQTRLIHNITLMRLVMRIWTTVIDLRDDHGIFSDPHVQKVTLKTAIGECFGGLILHPTFELKINRAFLQKLESVKFKKALNRGLIWVRITRPCEEGYRATASDAEPKKEHEYSIGSNKY